LKDKVRYFDVDPLPVREPGVFVYGSFGNVIVSMIELAEMFLKEAPHKHGLHCNGYTIVIKQLKEEKIKIIVDKGQYNIEAREYETFEGKSIADSDKSDIDWVNADTGEKSWE